MISDLVDVSSTLDSVTEDLHSTQVQLHQLQSMRDVHSASALAMALRKMNSSFLKQVTEIQTLRQKAEALEAERDEAWKHAEAVALDFDQLNDRLAGAGIATPPRTS